MRDDVKQLFDSLLHWHAKKLELLKKLHTSESEKNFLLKTESIEELAELIEDDDELIAGIDLIDVEISSDRLAICTLCGIDENDFDRVFLSEKSGGPEALRELESKTSGIIKEMQEDRSRLLKKMEEKRNEVEEDANSLSRIMKLKGKKP